MNVTMKRGRGATKKPRLTTDNLQNGQIGVRVTAQGTYYYVCHEDGITQIHLGMYNKESFVSIEPTEDTDDLDEILPPGSEITIKSDK